MTPHTVSEIPEKYIYSFNMNGLNGRYVKIPHTKRRRNILLVYGSHTSLEKMYGLTRAFSRFGTVTIPDLPGFGGMDSLYRINDEPSIDALADYLASFVKLHYKKKRLTVVGFGIGSAVATRMLQKYPDITRLVDTVVSVSGFTSKKDFKIPVVKRKLLKAGATVLSGKLSAKIFSSLFLNRTLVRLYVRRNTKGLDKQSRRKLVRFESELWKINDLRTHARTTVSMLTIDLTSWQVPLHIHHVYTPADGSFLNHEAVTQHMEMVFSRVREHEVKGNGRMPSIISEAAEAEKIIPPTLHRVLTRTPRKA